MREDQRNMIPNGSGFINYDKLLEFAEQAESEVKDRVKGWITDRLPYETRDIVNAYIDELRGLFGDIDHEVMERALLDLELIDKEGGNETR